jgi:NADH-quinone oxidoreductase subunit E
MEEIADACATTAADVLGVCSFYTMYKRRPCGRLVVSVCTNVTCLVLGGPELYEHLEHRYATDPEVFVEEVECLAACDHAPLMQVNYEYHGDLTIAAAEQIVDDYKSGTRVARGVSGGKVQP